MRPFDEGISVLFSDDPAGWRLPVKLDTATNGEFAPIPLDPPRHQANVLAHETVSVNAKRLSMARREFLVSACGVTTNLLCMNAAYARAGLRNRFFYIPKEAVLDLELARSAVDRGQLIFDVQGHFINPSGAWTKRLPPRAKPLQEFAPSRPEVRCKPRESSGLDYLSCFGPDQFIKDVFMDSDTDLMVLSFVPSSFMPSTRVIRHLLTIEEAAATARIVEKLEGNHRLSIHGRVNPAEKVDLEGMDELAARHQISAWKTCTQPAVGAGFWLDDDAGLAFIEKARTLGVRNIAVHKSVPFGPHSYEHSTCADVGRDAYREHSDPSFRTYRPKNRRDFLRLKGWDN